MNVNSKNIVTLSVFASINSLYILMFVFEQNLLQILCSLAMMLLSLSGVIVFFKIHKTSDVDGSEKLEIISKERIDSIVNTIYEKLNDYLTVIRRYLLWENRIKNGVVLASLYFLSNIFSIMSFSVFFYLFTWVLFLYTYINDTYINQIVKIVTPIIEDLKQHAKNAYNNIPKLQHLKKNI